MFSEFILAVKSTIDREGKQLASDLGIADFVDLDDPLLASKVLTGTSPALVWKFSGLLEDPIDPLYSLSFVIGVKTTSDPANYTMLDFVSRMKEVFRVGVFMEIKDWSKAVELPTIHGSMYFTESGVEQQVSDKESGIRLLAVEAKVARET